MLGINTSKLKYKEKVRRRSVAERIVFAVTFIIFFLYALSLLYVFYWAFIASLKEILEYFESPFAMPKKWLFSNFATAMKELSINDTSFFTMTFNSIWFSVGSTIAGMAVSTLTAYVVSKYKFPGREFLYALAVFIMIVPIYGTLPATYRLYNKYNLTNSPMLLITKTVGIGFNFILLHGYFKNLSWSYAEAAFIDGAGHFKVFLSVMAPQVMPAVGSLSLLMFIGAWNDYMTPMLYLDKMSTLASGLFTYQEIAMRMGNIPIYFAGVLLSMLPILILYTIFHKVIMENTSAGGLKG